MSNVPLISIIVPVYNSELWIEKCIKSILNQTFKDFELILVDDGSKDSSLKVIQFYASIDKRVVFFHKENTGVSDTRNYGVLKAKGKWITFVDSDDSLKPCCLEKLVPLDGTIDMSICGAEINKKNEVSDCLFRPGYEVADGVYSIADIYNNLINQVLNGPVRKLFKRTYIINNNILFPKEKSYGEDVDFVYAYLDNVSKVQISSYNGYEINVVNNDSLSLSVSASEHYKTIVHNFQTYKDFMKKKAIVDSSYVDRYYDYNVFVAVSKSYWRKNALSHSKRIELYKELFYRMAWMRIKLPFYFRPLAEINGWLLIDFFRCVRFAFVKILKRFV